MKCKQTGRCTLLVICILQIVSTGERQLFDFLGRMWIPILLNFFNLIFVIFGFFGAYQYKPKYIIIYFIWMLVWLAWNVFVICFYMNVGSLSNDEDVLNLGTGSASWWEVNGIGCDPVYPTNLTQVDILRPLRPVFVKGCLLNYEYVESIHASFQAVFSIIGLCVSAYLLKKFQRLNENKKNKPPLYYVQYSSSSKREVDESSEPGGDEVYQHPMTPRRVKRQNRHRSSGRSVNRAGVIGQSRTNTLESAATRMSQRTRKPKYLNPVRQLLENANDSSTSTDATFQVADTHPIRPVSYGGRLGHSNPTYVHSRPNSTHSLNSPPEIFERPASVHSSYSNYHGQRPSLNPNPTVNANVTQFNAALRNTTANRKNNNTNMIKSTFRPEIRIPSVQPNYYGTSVDSTYSGDSYRESERPPPYMFGVNSETVI